MAIIVNVYGNNNCMYSDTVDSVTTESIMYVCNLFACEYYSMPEEIFVIGSGKVIEINLQSVLQSELDKQMGII